MVSKLHKNSGGYAVADEGFIQPEADVNNGSPGDWVTSALYEEEIEDLMSGKLALRDFDLDADPAEDLEDFLEVPEYD